MLKITIPELELFDDDHQEFIKKPAVDLHLEHSLVSLSKWESKWQIPFLGEQDKSDEQVVDYIRMMCSDENIDLEVFQRLSQENFDEIGAYINRQDTATWFSDVEKPKKSSEAVTSEIIYYWMISLNIPFECQHWHLSRLLTLIRVCDHKNDPDKHSKKMSKAERAAHNRALNAKRKANLKTRG